MKKQHKVYLGVTVGALALLGLAQMRSKSKCRDRLAAIRKAYPNAKTTADLKVAVQRDGGTWPDCTGVTIFREGV